jgi:hypothetical protein
MDGWTAENHHQKQSSFYDDRKMVTIQQNI